MIVFSRRLSMPASFLFQYPSQLPHRDSYSRRSRQCCYPRSALTSETALQLSTVRPISEVAIEAIRTAYSTANAAIHHGTCAHTLGRAATDVYEKAHQSVANLVNASNSSEIIFAPSEISATELFARSFTSSLRKGDEIVLTATEPDSTRKIWASIAARRQLKTRIVYPDENGQIAFEDIASMLCERTRLIVLHASCPLLGAFIPVEDLISFITGAGVPVLLNTSHALQYASIDVKRIGPDFLIADGAGLGAPNSAFLYGRQQQLKRLPPCFGGDEVLENFDMQADLDNGNWSDIPGRFAVGMPSISSTTALGAVATDILERRSRTFTQHSTKIAAHLCDRLINCPHVIVYGAEAERRTPTACFNVDGLDGANLMNELDQRGIGVDYGCHGARTTHLQTLKCPSSLRVSFDPARHIIRDVDNFVEVLSTSIEKLLTAQPI